MQSLYKLTARTNNLASWFCGGLTTMILLSCSQAVPLNELSNNESYSSFDTNIYPLNALVCDPMSEPTGPVDPGMGLIGSLYYLQPNERYYSVPEYLQNGTKSPQKIFYSELNVPTRKFELGFPIETGGMVKNDNGDDLVEFFALQFSSILVLRPDQQEGLYELALLSDDGAIFKVREQNGQYVAYVTNDGDHPTRFGCGTTPIQMNRESEHVVSIEYYQGPRYHISLIPMWRKITESTQPDPLCGATGNETFFDYNNNSTPTSNYQALLSRGWEPIQPGNYRLPASAAFNPCTTAPAPIISNMKIESNLDGGLIVKWSTDMSTTSQVLYKNMSTGIEILTKSDNVLRTSHAIVIPAPPSGQSIEIRAISISDQYGKAMSDPIISEN